MNGPPTETKGMAMEYRVDVTDVPLIAVTFAMGGCCACTKPFRHDRRGT